MTDILNRILARKAEEVAERKAKMSKRKSPRACRRLSPK